MTEKEKEAAAEAAAKKEAAAAPAKKAAPPAPLQPLSGQKTAEPIPAGKQLYKVVLRHCDLPIEHEHEVIAANPEDALVVLVKKCPECEGFVKSRRPDISVTEIKP